MGFEVDQMFPAEDYDYGMVPYWEVQQRQGKSLLCGEVMGNKLVLVSLEWHFQVW